MARNETARGPTPGTQRVGEDAMIADAALGREEEYTIGALVPVTAGRAAAGVARAEKRLFTRRSLVRYPRRDGWTVERRRLFLECLSATCCVTLSAKRAGMSPSGARQLRERDAEFSGLWETALAFGKARLREDLLAYALGRRSSGDNPADIDFDAPRAEPFDPELAIKVLTYLDGRPEPGSQRRAAAPTQGQVDAVLLARLDELVKRGRG